MALFQKARFIVKISSKMMSALSLHRDEAAKAVDNHLEKLRRNDEKAAFGVLFEEFIEVCSNLSYLGEIYGYIDTDTRGVVDFHQSYLPFVERFVRCMILMHDWCIRTGGDGKKFVNRILKTSEESSKVVQSTPMYSWARLESAVYPHDKNHKVAPERINRLPDFYLKQEFLREAKAALELLDGKVVDRGENSPPLLGTQGVCVYLKERKTPSIPSQLDVLLGKFDGSHTDQAILIRLGSGGNVAYPGWDLQWSLEPWRRSME